MCYHQQQGTEGLRDHQCAFCLDGERERDSKGEGRGRKGEEGKEVGGGREMV